MGFRCRERVTKLVQLVFVSVIFGGILLLNNYIYLGLIYIFLPCMYFLTDYILWRNGIYIL